MSSKPTEIKPEEEISTSSTQKKSQEENNQDIQDDKAPLKYVFQTVDDPSHYSHIFTKENFKTLEKWGLSQNMELVKFRFNTS